MKLFLTALLFSQLSFAGGISGGGGNVINPTPPSSYQDPREIRHIIHGSKFLLCKFIAAKYALYKSGSMSDEDIQMYSVLFADHGFNLHEVMEEISLDIPLDRPCYDQDGNIFDGSTFNQKENSVCISAYSIAKKVDKLEVPMQSAALVMHEFSEVVGLTDDEAIVLQNEVLKELKYW